MARALGIGTTEFLSRYTEEGGTTLRTTADGRCVFVGPDGGCRVHARRPLVCRLYPLGRQTRGKAGERFALYGTHPGCRAAVGRDGTVASFLESQGTEPYFEWARRYGDLYVRMIEILDRAEPEPEPEPETAEGPAAGNPDEPGTPEKPGAQLSPWLDIDASLAEYCGARGLTPPADIDAAIALHIRAMEEWIEALEAGPSASA